MCSGAIKKLSPSAVLWVVKVSGTDVSARTGARRTHTSRKIDERSPAADDTRQAKSMRNQTAAQLLAWFRPFGS